MLRSVKDLQGYTIHATNGEIGKVKEFLFDDQSWAIRYMVADTGGWLTGRLVLISPNALKGSDWANEVLPVSLTKEQVENAPSIYEDQPVSRQYEADYHDYYGYPYYWGTAYAGLAPAYAPMVPAGAYTRGADGRDGLSEAPIQQDQGDPHLRSTEEVTGYDIQARDGEIGHIDDFLVDDASWRIESVVVATRDWLPGKKVVIPSQAIQEVDWTQSHATVNMRRSDIESAQEYDPAITSAPDRPAQLLL
ncbi:MAG: PRC-barrel domain-containing protein [Chloroflexota bacterium]|nr:PRC-barrel domain-containing protein [Chloroflexota bacterium]